MKTYFLENKKQILISKFLGKIGELLEIIQELKTEEIFTNSLDDLITLLKYYVGKPQEITQDIAGNLLYI